MRGTVVLLALLLTAIAASPCHRECDSRLSLDEDDFDVACNETCKIQKCYEGCDLWTDAISSTCHDVCEEETKVFKKKSSLYCVRGCSIAINIYIKSVEEKLGTPAAPYLVAETRTSTSISIAWTASPFQNISYLVQLRNDGLHPSDWEYYQPFNLLQDNSLKVEDLHPYTKYRFRVAWILLENYPPLFSEESFVISTFPEGLPSTPPSLTCLTAVSCCRVSVSWNSPLLPNGPILSYVLYIREHLTTNIMIKDVSDLSDGLHYMINGLKPSTSYTISLRARNTMGEGPADERSVATLPERESSNLSHPSGYLVFAARHRLLKQGLRILDESRVLFEVPDKSTAITGVALHVQQNIFFVSDSEGSIHSVSFKKQKVKNILRRNDTHPHSLSVDWLHQKLYMAEEDQITRCDLNGNDYEVLVNDLKARPDDLHVDPLNGYLYWVMRDPGGLYRIDLVEFESGCGISPERAELIVADSQIRAFALDHKNFRLLLPSPANNTIVSVALDGGDAADVRENSQTPQYRNIRSMAVHRDLLYWTSEKELFGEEYHKRENKFYQNLYSVGEGPFLALNVHHSDFQPHPVPLNPVESVEVLFGYDKAKIRWSSPRRLAGEGKGSFKRWFYEMNMFEKDQVLPLVSYNLSGNDHRVNSLKPNTSYTVKLRAYSEGGEGPWSSEFVGSTLDREDTKFPVILWGAQDGLLKSNAIGEDVELLIHKININNARITDVCAYGSRLFINTNTSFVYILSTSVHNSLTRLQNISMASGIALDWFAPKLYWSSPVQQIISRSNLDGSQPEPLPILTMAREIAVDSVEAHLYYATSHSVERARLNGRDHFVYMEEALFSGKHVMGLTLDFERKHLYWMVRSYEGSQLFRACLAEGDGSGCRPEKPDFVGELLQEGLYGPFWYFSSRFYWLHENQKSFVSDIHGRNVAEINSPGLTGLSTLGIIDPSLQPYPPGYSRESMRVVPLSVSESSVCIDGTSERFNITWSPDTSVNYGDVLYEIRLDDGDEVYNLVTSETVFVYPPMKYLSPYTSLTIAVQAFTFYASARQTIVNRHSPMSVPSKPLQPRVFIVYKSPPLKPNSDIAAIYRWLPPNEANGLIVSYRVTCWYVEDEARIPACDDVVGGKTLEYRSASLLPNTTYYFQVLGSTSAGEGEGSEVSSAETSVERPVPQLLLANRDGVRMADIDSREERLLLQGGKTVHPAAIAYLAHEKRLFWMEEGGLMVSAMDGTNTSQIKRLTSEGTCLTVDWVGQHLYWAEVNKREGYSNIVRFDLAYDNEPKQVFNHSSTITSLEVEPFSGSLIWTLSTENSCSLMISDVSGSNVRPFFSRSLEYESFSGKMKVKRMTNSSACNCAPSAPVGAAITLDTTQSDQPRILFVDGIMGHIWSSDMEGCMCRLLFNATENKESGLPPTSLTADKASVYWSNETLGRVFSLPKATQIVQEPCDSPSPVVTEEIRGIRSIRAIGNYLQPYPDPTCLLFDVYKERAQLVERFWSSLVLRLPLTHRPDHCSRMSAPSVQYTVYYEPSVDAASNHSCFGNSTERCKAVNTFDSSVTLSHLQPYTHYTIRVSAQNYYSTGIPSLGPPVEYLTDEGELTHELIHSDCSQVNITTLNGDKRRRTAFLTFNVCAPSPPLNVSATSVTPLRIDVTWSPSLHFHGPSVSYEVCWWVKGSSVGPFSAVHSECGNHSMTTGDNQLSKMISTLEPGEEHHIIVRAYSSNCLLHSDSEEVTVTAFGPPSNLTLLSVSSTSLLLTWIPPTDDTVSDYYLEYREADNLEWLLDVQESTSSSSEILFEIQNLVPRTRYSAKLVITYQQEEARFIWPRNSFFEFVTLGDAPSTPGKPQLKLMGRDMYEVFWYASINHGYEDLVYELQQRSENPDDQWTTVYNQSSAEWIVDGISTHVHYEFRVLAYNEFGASNYSYSEKPFYLPETGAYVEQAAEPIGIVVASCIATAVLLIMILSSLYMIHIKKKEKNKKILEDVATSNQLVPDLELATLQDLPLHANFVHQTNALYNLSDLPTDEELAQVQRDQIILTKFLGSGAFGEVFEGIVYGLNEEMPSLKIAIKTLKKGATEREKEEFLKEAKLMSNFKHEHILQLLGVCFDNNPNFIILELMEGGDLLSFLRSNRPTVYQSSLLTMDDLIDICIDVAEGCKYLEDMHFVHRDLAARNCLVSSYDRSERIVKIGDFGLARDIYKNDYYRKEGEVLLPVRWMAPESLVYGVFTSHSDVWAFGVLLWEVITLGQQPYPARSNIEVLNYVRAGGRLDKPENCPDDLHEVMARCWSYDAESRPTFFYCLNALKELRDKLVSSTLIMPAVYNFNYLGETNLGFDNLGYCGSELVEVSTPDTDDTESIEDEIISGTYLVQNDFLENSVDKFQDQNLDSRSDPATPSEMTEAKTTLLRRSSSWSSCDLASQNMGKRVVNKYLEILGDNEDADGYQLPLHDSTKTRSSPNGQCKETNHSTDVVSECSPYTNGFPKCSLLLQGEENEKEPNDAEITSHSKSCPSWLEDCDDWSISTASTITCHLDHHRNSGASILSCLSGIDLDYASKSSVC